MEANRRRQPPSPKRYVGSRKHYGGSGKMGDLTAESLTTRKDEQEQAGGAERGRERPQRREPAISNQSSVNG